MTLPLAADLLLLAYADETGKPVLESTKLNALLAGATVLELTMDGVLDIADEQGPVKKGRMFRVPGRSAHDELLDEIAEACEGSKPADAISHIAGISSFRDRAGKVREALLLRLADEGLLREERAKVLGLFPTSRWPTADPSYEQSVVDRVRAVLVHGHAPDQRTAAVISLMSAVDLTPKVLPDADKKQVRQRAKQIAESDWAAAGVKKAVDSVTAALYVAAVMVPAVTSTQ